MDDDSTGEIVISGNVNFISHVISAGYSALCNPAAFIATNGNVTISNDANIQVFSPSSSSSSFTTTSTSTTNTSTTIIVAHQIPELVTKAISVQQERAKPRPCNLCPGKLTFVHRGHVTLTVLLHFLIACLQNIFIMGNFDASNTSFNGQVL